MSPTEIRDLLKERARAYVVSDVSSSLRRNSYMNEYQNEDIDEEQVRSLLSALINRATFSHTRIYDILNELIAAAKQVRFNSTELSLSTIDAILVDYINSVASCWGVDYVMYTVDLRPSCL